MTQPGTLPWCFHCKGLFDQLIVNNMFMHLLLCGLYMCLLAVFFCHT